MATDPQTRIIIYGAGGLGREALEILAAMRQAGHGVDCAGFFVDPGFATSPVHEVPVYDRWDAVDRAEACKVVLAIGDGCSRRRVAREIETLLGHDCFATLVHPQAVVGRTVTLGEGAIIFPATSLTSDVRIGRHVVINPGCTVAHDCELADFATLGPSVALAGDVNVEEGCTIGTGASVLPHIRLGAWSVIGAGAVVNRAVANAVTVAGVPARALYKKSP